MGLIPFQSYSLATNINLEYIYQLNGQVPVGQELSDSPFLLDDEPRPNEEKVFWIFLLPHFLQINSSFFPPIPINKSNFSPQSLQT